MIPRVNKYIVKCEQSRMLYTALNTNKIQQYLYSQTYVEGSQKAKVQVNSICIRFKIHKIKLQCQK